MLRRPGSLLLLGVFNLPTLFLAVGPCISCSRLPRFPPVAGNGLDFLFGLALDRGLHVLSAAWRVPLTEPFVAASGRMSHIFSPLAFGGVLLLFHEMLHGRELGSTCLGP